MASKKTTTKRGKGGAKHAREVPVLSAEQVLELDEPWQPLEAETASAYEAFCIYRSLGPSRTIARAFESYSNKRGLSGKTFHGRFGAWSSAHFWVVRAEAWDKRVGALTAEQQAAALVFAQQQLVEALPQIVSTAIQRACMGDSKLLIDLMDRAHLELSVDAGKGNAKASLADTLADLLGGRATPKRGGY